ncbi:DUF2599 domain-containing protein [Rathayibacter tritici]|uniref:DUF2599 domain-containing protein n=1 Tax=Rathayibacter tritici TaxID=33888 RepID=A0A160KU85_9MICO|nr:DUF2599 domain-containing protein [Rathayibacter tritici]AND16828.1 hypothetical protein A6122_1695 [Rathayibacter tritici]PPI43608.1 DUF2599 domain-containing protein [Rathayibacter tritici]
MIALATTVRKPAPRQDPNIRVSSTTALAAAASAAQPPTPDAVAALASASPEALANTATPTPSPRGSKQKSVVSNAPLLAFGTDSTTPVTVGAPFADTATAAPTQQAGVTVYDNRNSTSTVAVTHTDGSVAVNTVIGSSSAPHASSDNLDLPVGSSLHANDSGTVSVLDAVGFWSGGVKAAWARDANGTSIPTHYDIAGTTLTQIVDLSQPGIAFPLVADSWFGQDLIDHVTWVQGDPQRGPTAQVYPTDYGRDQLAVGPDANEAAWGEALEKGDRSRLDHNNLHDQFSCRFLGRTSIAGKESWNLDSNRPDVGLAATIAASCTPQGGED